MKPAGRNGHRAHPHGAGEYRGVATEAFSVEGQIESVDGTRADFSGWMGLVNSLERLLVRVPTYSSPAPTTPEPAPCSSRSRASCNREDTPRVA